MTRRNQPWEDQGAQHSKYRKEQEQKPVRVKKLGSRNKKEGGAARARHEGECGL